MTKPMVTAAARDLAMLRRLASLREAQALAEVAALSAQARDFRDRHQQIEAERCAVNACVQGDPTLGLLAARHHGWADAAQTRINEALAKVEVLRAKAVSQAVAEVGRSDVLARLDDRRSRATRRAAQEAMCDAILEQTCLGTSRHEPLMVGDKPML
ncbi:hypothetical protein ACEYYB_06045 [Paracoccus sp. p4-l81]|uniref:hypothetical protein n=1 Tax=Paracoccus sp. p4-l81 TaxID=3342806 RepID=UPI0035B70F3D